LSRTQVEGSYEQCQGIIDLSNNQPERVRPQPEEKSVAVVLFISIFVKKARIVQDFDTNRPFFFWFCCHTFA